MFAELFVRDSMTRGLRSARKSLNAFGQTGVRVASLATAAFGAAMVVGAKRTMAMAGTLDDMSVNTGIAVGGVMKLRKQFELGGLAADSMGGSIAKMQRAISTAAGGGKDPFSAMNLSAEELMTMAPDKAFDRIGQAILGIEGSTARAAAAMEIFGKSGASMINVFGQAKDAEQFLGRMPQIMQEYAGALARADDLSNELPGKGSQFVTGFTAGIIGQVLPALEKTAAFDFTTMGENLGVALSDGVNVIANGEAWELFQLHADMALQTIQASPSMNGLSAAINTALSPVAWQAFTMAGEAALLRLQSSPAMNGWAATINAVIDGFSPSDPSGKAYSFLDSFDRYAEAGIDANAEIVAGLTDSLSDLPTAAELFAKYMEDGTAATLENIDAIQSRIDAINGRARTQTEIQRKEVATDAAAAAAEAAELQARTGGMNAASLVNDYQRRGLSLDPSGASNGQRSMQKSVDQILSLLVKNFRITRSPVF